MVGWESRPRLLDRILSANHRHDIAAWKTTDFGRLFGHVSIAFLFVVGVVEKGSWSWASVFQPPERVVVSHSARSCLRVGTTALRRKSLPINGILYLIVSAWCIPY